MDIKTICELIETNKQELFELLSNLIKINSESFGEHGNEKTCAEYILKLCNELGLSSEMYSPLELENFEQSPDYFPGRNLENRYNVTAKWKGTEDCDKLMLMAHIDTVEFGSESSWDKSPLSGEISDGKIFGRGSGDDKYAIATCLFLIKLLKNAGLVPKKNLVFNAYCDEELGGSHGAMAAVIKDPCDIIINLDGRKNQIWHCASGGQVVTYKYRVNETVSSAEPTAKAFPIVLKELSKFGNRRRKELEKNPYYKGTIIPETSMRYNEIRAGNNDMDKDVGLLKFTFYTDKTKEEIWDEFSKIDSVLQKKLKALGITSEGFNAETRFFHYGACDTENAEIKNLVDCAKEATGEETLVCGSCLSDLSILLKYGSANTFAYGGGRDFSEPGGPHQPNEFIECDDLVNFTKKIAAYVLKTLF
ncbi:MAG: M20 family metallopeptidase [Clostridia bacterium]|nr:M20 family metallopeptidase [Clostridia bacterium]